MISEVVLVGLITAGTAIISVYITNYFNEKRFQQKNREWFLNNILPMKIKSIIDINSKMTECYENITLYGNIGLQDIDTYRKEVSNKVDEFVRLKNEADIWLNEDLNKSLTSTSGVFRNSKFAIWLSLPETELPRNVKPESYGLNIKEINWERLEDSYKNSKKKLRKNVGAKELEKYITQIMKK